MARTRNSKAAHTLALKMNANHVAAPQDTAPAPIAQDDDIILSTAQRHVRGFWTADRFPEAIQLAQAMQVATRHKVAVYDRHSIAAGQRSLDANRFSISTKRPIPNDEGNVGYLHYALDANGKTIKQAVIDKINTKAFHDRQRELKKQSHSILRTAQQQDDEDRKNAVKHGKAAPAPRGRVRKLVDRIWVKDDLFGAMAMAEALSLGATTVTYVFKCKRGYGIISDKTPHPSCPIIGRMRHGIWTPDDQWTQRNMPLLLAFSVTLRDPLAPATNIREKTVYAHDEYEARERFIQQLDEADDDAYYWIDEEYMEVDQLETETPLKDLQEAHEALRSYYEELGWNADNTVTPGASDEADAQTYQTTFTQSFTRS